MLLRWHRDPTSGTFKREQTVVEWLDLSATERVLDAGCGPCTLSATLARTSARPVALDPDAAALQLGRDVLADEAGPGSGLLCRGDVSSLPFADNTFSAAVFSDVVEHLPYRAERRAFTELGRVLTPGGRLVVTTWPNRRNPFWRLRYWTGHGPQEDRYPRDRPGLVTALEAAGLAIERTRLDNVYLDAGIISLSVNGLRGTTRGDRWAEECLRRAPRWLGDWIASSITIMARKPLAHAP